MHRDVQSRLWTGTQYLHMESLVLYRPRKGQKQSASTVAKRAGRSIPLAQTGSTKSASRKVVGGTNQITVSHREMIDTVAGSVGFNVNTIVNLTPSDVCFSWLSRLAENFEEWRLNSLVFTYESSKAATSPGLIYMAPDYDTTDAAPTSGAIMASYQDAVSGNAYCSLRCALRPASLHRHHKELFTGSPAAGTDPHTYYGGNFFLATEGCADTTIHGRLFAEYSVTLMIPELRPQAPIAMLGSEDVDQTSAFATLTRANCYGTAGTPAICRGDQLATAPFGSSLRFLKRGIYIVRYLVRYFNAWLANPTTAASTASVTPFTGADGVAGAAGGGIAQFAYMVQVSAIDQICATNFTGSLGADADLGGLGVYITEHNVQFRDASVEA